MDTPIIVGAIAGIPIVLALLLRVNAVFLFLSVITGNLLVLHVSDDAELVVRMAVRSDQVPTITKFGLLLVPVALTLLFMRKTLSSAKLPLHLVPLVATGATLAIFALPLLGSAAQDQIFNLPYGNVIKDAQDLIVSATAFLTLVLVWLTYRHKADKSAKHHK